MDIEKLMTTLRKKYKTDVKSWIEKGEYPLARIEMANIMTLINQYNRDIVFGVHCGARFSGYGEILYEELKKENPGEKILKSKMKIFETFMAQTKLPNK